MIDKKHIGMVLPSHSAVVEAGRLRFFAQAIGETNPVYSDVAAAQSAGYRHLPVPPTFLFSLDLEKPNALGWIEILGISLKKLLHGEQSFTYHEVACAGDVLTFESRITDIYDKKNGALDFVVRQTNVKDANGRAIAELRSTLVQRH